MPQQDASAVGYRLEDSRSLIDGIYGTSVILGTVYLFHVWQEDCCTIDSRRQSLSNKMSATGR